MHNIFIPVDTAQHVFQKSKLILYDRSTVLKSAQSQLSNKLHLNLLIIFYFMHPVIYLFYGEK